MPWTHRNARYSDVPWKPKPGMAIMGAEVLGAVVAAAVAAGGGALTAAAGAVGAAVPAAGGADVLGVLVALPDDD